MTVAFDGVRDGPRRLDHEEGIWIREEVGDAGVGGAAQVQQGAEAHGAGGVVALAQCCFEVSDAVERVAGCVTQEGVPVGVVFEQGEEGGSLYVVTTGKLSIDVDGREVACVQSGACIGEMALISGLPRSATAIAIDDVRLLRLGADEFDALLSSEPEIGLALLRTLALRLRTATRS